MSQSPPPKQRRRQVSSPDKFVARRNWQNGASRIALKRNELGIAGDVAPPIKPQPAQHDLKPDIQNQLLGRVIALEAQVAALQDSSLNSSSHLFVTPVTTWEPISQAGSPFIQDLLDDAKLPRKTRKKSAKLPGVPAEELSLQCASVKFIQKCCRRFQATQRVFNSIVTETSPEVNGETQSSVVNNKPLGAPPEVLRSVTQDHSESLDDFCSDESAFELDDNTKVNDLPAAQNCDASFLRAYREATKNPKTVFDAFDYIVEAAHVAGGRSFCESLGVDFQELFILPSVERFRQEASDIHPDYGGELPLDDESAVDFVRDCFSKIKADLEELRKRGYI
jgi:hypothetical protein